jgi:hypothetical protein
LGAGDKGQGTGQGNYEMRERHEKGE